MRTQIYTLCRHTAHFCFIVLLLSLFACRDDTPPVTPQEPDTEEEETAELSDAYHDKIRTTPYPKANNELYLNPPPLIVPQSMKTGERLLFELSPSENFSSTETMRSEAEEWCLFNPHRKLETGTWYWRFRQADAHGTPQGEWSDTYQFEVSDETPVFVTPAFNEFKSRMPYRYPRLYCYLDPKIETARLNAKSHREYKMLLSRAQDAINTDYTTVNPNEKAETLCTHMQSLYDARHLTQDDKYSNYMYLLLKQMLAYPVSDALLFKSNFGSTNIALCYARIYDQLYNQLTPDERTAIEELIMRVLRRYYPQHRGTQENHIFDNHFWQQNMRVIFQCAFLLHDNPAYADEVLPMLKYYYELWTARAPASGFNRDGIWHNGSGYFNTNLETLHYMPMLFSYITGSDFLQHPWYKNAGRSLAYTWPPHSKSSGFGDGSENGNEPVRQRAAFADFIARELNDPYAGWYASECDQTMQGDILFRLYRICSTHRYNTSLPVDAAKMVWYEDTGEVAMHSCLENTDKDVNLSFRSSTFGSGSHTTSSQNAFNLLFKGKEIYRSSGYYLNFSDAHNLMSYRHSRAHNTILVNGIGQPYSTRGYGNIMRTLEGEHITYCLGDASKAYCGISEDPMWVEAFEKAGITQTPENGFGETPLTKYRRHVLMLHPEGIVLIYDELEASEPVAYDWLLHSPSQLSLNKELLTINHSSHEFGYTAVTQLFCNNPVNMSLTDRFRVAPDPATMKKGKSYPNQWHMTARIEGEAKTRILAVIQANASGIPPQIIRKTGNTLTIGKWTVNAELDASQPASLSITHADTPVYFSYGKENPVLNGTPYPRENTMSSLLYDAINGEYKVTEMNDRLPATTRVAR